MTVNILIYHGKHGDQHWLVNTPERMAGAIKALFQQLDEFNCYEDCSQQETKWRNAARAGSIRCARMLLDAHNGAEYECWEIENAEIAE